jgi:hypothetical protein
LTVEYWRVGFQPWCLEARELKIRRFQGESGSFLFRAALGLGRKLDNWILTWELIFPFFIERPCPNLQEKMSAVLAPLHLLALRHCLLTTD